jgi:hypothetical protein
MSKKSKKRNKFLKEHFSSVSDKAKDPEWWKGIDRWNTEPISQPKAEFELKFTTGINPSLLQLNLTNNNYKETPDHIIFNGVTTICIFHDGTKVISRPQNGEKFDRETGVAMCIAKYVYGSRSKFLRAVESGHEQKRGDE